MVAEHLLNPYGAIDATAVAAVVAALLGGGFIAAIAAWRKAGPEAEAIAAKTLIQVNDELRKELSRRAEESTLQLRQRDEQISALRERVAVLEQHEAAYADEIAKLTTQLEAVRARDDHLT